MENTVVKEEPKVVPVLSRFTTGLGMISINSIYTTVVSGFVLLYLTNIAGLNSAICGTLMLVAKIFDGISDVIFGGNIDRTKSKLGHARPWVIFGSIPTSLCLVLLFMVPQGSGWLPYAYFFIVYVLMQAVFYTATAIAVQTLPLLITKNQQERVSINVIGSILQIVTTVLVSGQTVRLVETFGGGAAGWRTVAIIYAVIAMVCLFFCGGNTKELPYEMASEDERITVSTLFKGLKTVLKNKYYVYLLIFFIAFALSQGITSAIGAHYYIYVLGSADLMGVFSLASMSMLVGVLAAPIFVGKLGIYKTNMISVGLSALLTILTIPFAYARNIPMMIVMTVLRSMPGGLYNATLYALAGDVATYSLLKDHAQVNALVTSTASVGYKVGAGVGTAISGIILSLAGFSAELEVQSAGTIGAINFTMVIVPCIIMLIMVFAMYKCNVQKGIRELKERLAAEGSAE